MPESVNINQQRIFHTYRALPQPILYYNTISNTQRILICIYRITIKSIHTFAKLETFANCQEFPGKIFILYDHICDKKTHPLVARIFSSISFVIVIISHDNHKCNPICEKKKKKTFVFSATVKSAISKKFPLITPRASQIISLQARIKFLFVRIARHGWWLSLLTMVQPKKEI